MAMKDEAWILELAERHQLDPKLVLELRSAVQAARVTNATVNLSEPTVDLSEEDGSLRSQPTLRIGRYEQLGLIGEGGMGEVFQVRDPELSRVMALKALRQHLASKAGQAARFREEAQITAQLRHPGVVAVHEFGLLEDGRIYFTMEEVQGRTLADILKELHGASDSRAWGTTKDGWTLRKVIEAFRRACETLAYAHARGVVHRDLKPSNLMLGDYGEVLVLDWGLAKVTGRSDAALDPSEEVTSERSQDHSLRTRVGKVFGTPAYMPPEQARGEWDRVGSTTDVYALGAVLYKVLCGRSPYRARSAHSVLDQVRQGPPRPLTQHRRCPPLPKGLVQICERAMAREPRDRYPDGKALAKALEAWLDGSMKRQQALVRVAEAQGLLPRSRALREEAQQAREAALQALEGVRGHDPVTRKHAAWALQDRAEEAEAQAALLQLDARRALHDALNLDPQLPEAHEALARIYKASQLQAERERDPLRASQWERLLRDHDRGEHADFLRGRGHLTLHSEPSGAEAVLYRYVEQGRRLRPERVRSLGQTPLERLELPMGDYLVVLHKEGHESVRYPVSIEREGHWDGRRPGWDVPTPIRLPQKGELGRDECLVSAGWFTSGGDPLAPSALPRSEVWVEPFIIAKHPVTNGQFCEFMNALAEAGQEQRAQELLPRFEGFPLLVKGPDGFVCRSDMEALIVRPDYPVVLLDWHAAQAYAEWWAERTGLPWRLPFELEWEKAARGVDGRPFPFGRHLDPTWCNMRESLPQRPMLLECGRFPADESPYGVQGMAGNSMDWCADRFREIGPRVLDGVALVEPQPGTGPRALRGGHFYGVGEITRAAHRYRLDPSYRGIMISLRLARPWPQP